MRSQIVKHSIAIAGHKTSISLETAFWDALKEIARRKDMSVSDIVGRIDAQRTHTNLSSAIRLYVLDNICAIRTT